MGAMFLLIWALVPPEEVQSDINGIELNVGFLSSFRYWLLELSFNLEDSFSPLSFSSSIKFIVSWVMNNGIVVA